MTSSEGLPLGGEVGTEQEAVRPDKVSAELKNTGLRGLVVADTMISDVDGAGGQLFYRGYAVEELAAGATYEEVAHLLLKGRLPEDGELGDFMDPRARVLRGVAGQMARDADDPLWFDLARRVEEVTMEEFRRRKGKDIFSNVDLYSAVVYRYMGIPKELNTPVFAIARAAGWGAHVIEERFGEAHGRPALYRPLAEYAGDYCGRDHCSFVPLSRRRS